jgi:predicted amidohydrolase YtcJ
MLWSQGIKMFIDGAQDSDSHWSWQEHFINFTTVDPGNYGYPSMDPDLYRAQVKMYHDAGLQVQTHAIGDRAIDWTLESYKLAEEANPIFGLRHGIIHCDIPTDWALITMLRMQRDYDAGYPYTQPDFMWWTEVIASTMGPELSLREMPYRTFEALGILYGFGTDWSVDPLVSMPV